jgi:anti-anti-sigma regulatory factor
MTLRIDTTTDGIVVTLRLCGRITAEQLDVVAKEMRARAGAIVLDLDEVTLVDVEVVRFLKDAERQGIELRNCPPFIREWIALE